MDSYPKDWNLFAFYGIYKDEQVRASQLGPYVRNKDVHEWDYHVVKENVQIDNWIKHHDYGAATIEPHEGGKLFVDVVALSPRSEQHVDWVEGVHHYPKPWYAKRWARELFGYTWLGLNEPEIDYYVYQMNVPEQFEDTVIHHRSGAS